MKIKLLTFCFVLANCITFSQNLVPNYSFENNFDCPTNNRPFCFVLQNNIYNWKSPTNMTAYHNSCVIEIPSCGTNFGIPTNFSGIQNAKNGNAYISLYAFGTGENRTIIPWPGYDYCIDYYRRGTAWVELTNSLTVGKKYYATYFASLSEDSDYARNSLGLGLRVDSIGTPTSMNNFDLNIWESCGKILSNDTVQLTSYTNWQQIQWIFEADSAYKHIVLGPTIQCPFPEDTIYTGANIITCALTSEWTYSYYYIDDVSLIEINGSSSNQTFCGNTATLSTPPNSFNHIWSNGGRTASTTITQSGTYTVFYRLDSLAFSDTIQVVFTPTIADNFLGQDTLYLIPQTLLTIEGPSGFTYQWNTGQTTRNIDITEPGIYILSITDELGCITTDTVEVFWDTTVGYDAFWQPQNLKIFPNPATNLLNISHDISDVCTLELYNAAGQMVLSENFSKQTQINVHTFPQGVYFIKVFSSNKMPIVKKVVINH